MISELSCGGDVITVTTPLAPTLVWFIYLLSAPFSTNSISLRTVLNGATRARHLTTTLLLLSNTPSCSIMSKFNSRQASRRGSRRASIDPLAKAPAAGEDFNVVFIGAGNIMFGMSFSTVGTNVCTDPHNNQDRLKVLGITLSVLNSTKLGPRLKVVALIDPALDRASAVLQKKRDSFVVSAYQNTKMYKTIDDFAKSMTPEEKPRAIIVGSPPHWRGSDLPGRNLEIKLLEYFPGVAFFIEKPVSTGPHTTALDISRRITEAGNVCSVGIRSLSSWPPPHAMYAHTSRSPSPIGGTSLASELVSGFGTEIRLTRLFPPAKAQSSSKERTSPNTGDLSRYFGGDVDISSVMAHSVEWDEEPGQLSKIPIDENKIAPENRIPRVTTATWKYENGAVGTLTHAVALHGTNYSCELEVYLDGYQMRLVDPYHIPTLYIRRPGDDYEETYRFGDDDPFFSEVSNLIDVIEHGEGTAEILSTYEGRFSILHSSSAVADVTIPDACKTYEFTWAIRLASERSRANYHKPTEA
ncbi:NAD binding dehydrogenase [Rhizoctonia solani AG-1 IA]|uniref:NAD binding dehydrogenase n=1 Tax=Thanatephorus cucumeris (strain AG1-IA) TaxID=983506 RepID=L8X3G0_THACA|nr:NAD binding dehydrogenase [Rhizoctonia solani AG-1 IA]